MNKKVLVVAAHPDDEVLGCGGTMALLAKRGYDVFTLVLGEGVTSRSGKAGDPGKLGELDRECEAANKILGVKKVFREAITDNRFDSLPLLTIVKAIEEVKAEVKPSVVFTHHAHDVNIDHQRTFEACLAAFRPMPGELIERLYSFYVVSSTDWQSPSKPVFNPQFHVDVTTTIKAKINALKAYVSEIRAFPHPRSAKGLEIEAQRAGLRVGVRYAEAFEVIRHIARDTF